MASRFAVAQTSMTDAVDVLADQANINVGVTTLNAAASPLTLTAAQVLAGVYTQSTAGAFALTFPTAALLVAAIPNCQAGSQGFFVVANTGNNTLTFTIGSGNTFRGGATATMPTATGQIFLWKVTNATLASEAVDYYPILKTAS